MAGYSEVVLEAARADSGRNAARREVEKVLELAEHLPAADRALLAAVYDRGLKFSQLAAASGQSAGRLRRRARRLMSRIASPPFAFVLRNERRWDPLQQRVARSIILEGRTIRDTARRLHSTEHRVRQAMTHIRALHADAGASLRANRAGAVAEVDDD